MAIEELRAMDVGECLGRRAPHHHDTAFVPQKNGCCSEMGNLRRAANNHQHTVLADASVASVAAPRIFRSGRNFSACDAPERASLELSQLSFKNLRACLFRLAPQKTMKPPSPKEPQDGLGH